MSLFALYCYFISPKSIIDSPFTGAYCFVIASSMCPCMLAPTMFNMLRLAVFLSYEIHVIDCKTLQGLTQASQGSAIFMAAFLKAVRLIDN